MRQIKIISLVLGLIFVSGCSWGGNGNGTAVPATGSIWKSSDGGKTWDLKIKMDEQTTVPTVDILSIAIDPQDSQNVFMGTRSGSLLRSKNGGENWEKLNFKSPKIYGLDVDPQDGRIVYASGVWNKRGKIFKSFDSGDTWKEIFTAPADGPLVISLLVDKNDPNIVLASTSDNQVLKSLNAGESWQNILNSQSPVIKVAVDSQDSNIIFALEQAGRILRSQDAGKTFEDLSEKISATGIYGSFNVIETDPQNEKWIYAGGAAGLLLSKDKGENWQIITSTINNSTNYPIQTIAIDPQNPSEIIYGSALAIYKSIDGGANWTTSQVESVQPAKILKYDPSGSGVIYLGLSK